MIREFELIEKIKRWIPRKLQAELPIGDDAAVFGAPKKEKLLYTTDMIVEGVDFYLKSSLKKRRGFLTAYEAGRKSLAVNLSDLAAMGARPLACVLTLGLAPHVKEAWLRDFYKGFVDLALEYNVKICGGDLTQSHEFFASVALIGSAKASEIVTRSGAKAGDLIAVTGALGGSLIKKHAAFTPRIKAAGFLAKQFKPSAMIDISDGLVQDLGHILESSKKNAVLEMLEIPISRDAVVLAKQDPMNALERACTDGEDFELLFTLAPKHKESLTRAWCKAFPNLPLSWIGKIVPGRGKVQWTCLGKKTAAPKFKKEGYQHFIP